jgi:uncharacterized protein (DUF885 family)
MVVGRRVRNVFALVSALLAFGSLPSAHGSADGDAAQLKALTTEFTSQRALAAGRGITAPLTTKEQANADAAWADAYLTRLHTLKADRLAHEDAITLAMLEFDAGVMKDAAPFFWLDIPITPYASPLRGLTGALAAMPLRTAADVDAYVDALLRVPVTVASYEARLRGQMNRGIVAPADEIRLAAPYIRAFGPSLEASPFRPGEQRFAQLPETERGHAHEIIDRAIVESVDPALGRLADFIEGPYRAKAPEGVGLAQYPDGRAYYQFLIHRYTSLSLTPEQIHAIGLGEVDRLERALDDTRRAAGFRGTLADFHTYLRDDPRFRAKSADDIGTRMMNAIARIEPKVDAFFPVKPKAAYGVRRLDPALEASMTYGYYQVPTAGEPKGLYLFNAFKPEQRSVLMAEATIYHELVPGHHFQIALQAENDGLVPYRRSMFFTAFTEGWGEYASDLAGEMGMYQDPYQRAGRLAMDLFVSTRLVVDTGMNALGWSRAKAIAYMREHTFESDLQIDTETLRYSADYQGQALAYKLGSRKIHELRDAAAKEQGSAFSLSAFHAYVLRDGAMPLSVLELHMACFGHERHAAVSGN